MTAPRFTHCAGCDCSDACRWAKVCMAKESARLMDEATDPAANEAPAWPWKAPAVADRQEVQP